MTLSAFLQDQLQEKIKQHEQERKQCNESVRFFETVIRTTLLENQANTYHIPIPYGCGPEIRTMLHSHQLHPWMATNVYAVKKLVISFDIEKNQYHVTLF
jgi:hypothetical protein